VKNLLLIISLGFVCFTFVSCDKNLEAVKIYLGQTLKDPNSVVIYSKQVVFDNSGVTILKVDYGAKNGYGGMVRSTYYFKIIDEVVYDSTEETIYLNDEMNKQDEAAKKHKERQENWEKRNESPVDYVKRP